MLSSGNHGNKPLGTIKGRIFLEELSVHKEATCFVELITLMHETGRYVTFSLRIITFLFMTVVTTPFFKAADVSPKKCQKY
jgi:hypothetical protein